MALAYSPPSYVSNKMMIYLILIELVTSTKEDRDSTAKNIDSTVGTVPKDDQSDSLEDGL